MASREDKNYILSIEEIRRSNRDRFYKAAVRWNDNANKTTSQISKYLFTIASLIIPLSFFPLNNTDIISTFDLKTRAILFLSLSSLVVSLPFGITHLIREAFFYQKWAEAESKRSGFFNESILTTKPIKAFERLNEMNGKVSKEPVLPENSNLRFLFVQAAAVFIGVLFLASVLVSYLFSSYSYTNALCDFHSRGVHQTKCKNYKNIH